MTKPKQKSDFKDNSGYVFIAGSKSTRDGPTITKGQENRSKAAVDNSRDVPDTQQKRGTPRSDRANTQIIGDALVENFKKVCWGRGKGSIEEESEMRTMAKRDPVTARRLGAMRAKERSGQARYDRKKKQGTPPASKRINSNRYLTAFGKPRFKIEVSTTRPDTPDERRDYYVDRARKDNNQG